MEVQPKQLFKQ